MSLFEPRVFKQGFLLPGAVPFKSTRSHSWDFLVVACLNHRRTSSFKMICLKVGVFPPKRRSVCQFIGCLMQEWTHMWKEALTIVTWLLICYMIYMILCQFHFLPLPIIHNKIRYSTNSGSFFVNSSQHQNKKKQKKYPFFSTTHGDLCVLAGFLATRDFQPSPGAEDTATSCTSSECLGRCRGRVLDGTMRWRSYRVNG